MRCFSGLNISLERKNTGEQQRNLFLLLLVVFCVSACSKPEIKAPPAAAKKKVVSLAPNLTEIIFAMNCGDLLVAVDENSDWPAETTRIEKVGQGLTPHIEKITRLRPDLVVASSSADQAALKARLARLNIALHVERTDRIADLPAAAKRLGNAIGCDGASAWGAEFEKQLTAQRRSRSRAPRILLLAWADPLYVAGAETFAGDLIATVGGSNAAGQVKGWPQYSLEAVAAAPPDVIVFPTTAFSSEKFLADLRAHPVWSRTPAVTRGHVLVVDEDTFTHAGPRTIDAATILGGELDRLGYR